MGTITNLDPVYVEHEPIQPQFFSGVARCEVIDDMVNWVFYVDRPHVVDGKIITEKVICGWMCMPLKNFVAGRLMTNTAVATTNIVNPDIRSRAHFQS